MPYNSGYKFFVGDGFQHMMVPGTTDPVIAKVRVNSYTSFAEEHKKDSETGNAQGQATLKGTEYGVYETSTGRLVTTVVTDENGHFKSNAVLSWNDYYLQEIKPSEGYKLDTTRYNVDIKGKESASVDVVEKVIKNYVSILKQYEQVDGNTTFLNAEKGITFEIYYPNGNKYGEITTDKNGYASLNLPYGVWNFNQVNTTTGYEKIYDFYITVNETSEKEQYYNILNNTLYAYLQVIKVDSETGKTIVIANTTFKILNTKSLAVFMPVRVQEINHENGIYYGQNVISKNMIIADRKQLLNGNSFIFGVSGSGKSFTAKNEIVSVILRNPNADVILIDPEREESRFVKALGGEVVHISTTSDNHINAMDMNSEYGDGANHVILKSEFILSLCDRLIGGNNLGPKQKSIIDRCTVSVYRNFQQGNYMGTPPTLQDFREELLKQTEPEAKEIALAIELFTNGRLICYDILDLGKQLQPIGMLMVLDSILNRITENRAKGRNTFIFIDEIYLLFQHEYSANSEFIVMLNQASTDRIELSKLLNISELQMGYITNVGVGQGLLKVGSSLIPFINKFPTNTKLYKLMTTKPGEGE